jgi:hypothetical protein
MGWLPDMMLKMECPGAIGRFIEPSGPQPARVKDRLVAGAAPHSPFPI